MVQVSPRGATLEQLLDTCLDPNIGGVHSPRDLDIFLAATYDPRMEGTSRNYPPEDADEAEAWVTYRVQRNWAEVPFACVDETSTRCALVVLSAARAAEALEDLPVSGITGIDTDEVIRIGRAFERHHRLYLYGGGDDWEDLPDVVPNDLLDKRQGSSMRWALRDCFGERDLPLPTTPRELQAYRGLIDLPRPHDTGSFLGNSDSQLELSYLEEEVYCGAEGFDMECRAARLGVAALEARLEQQPLEGDHYRETESFVEDVMDTIP